MFKNIMGFEVKSGMSELTNIYLDLTLSKFESRELRKQEQSNCGWSSPSPKGCKDLVFSMDEVTLITFQEDYRDIPAAVVKRELEKEIRKIEQDEGRKVSIQEKRDLKSSVVFELSQKAFIKQRRINVLISSEAKMIFIDTSVASQADKVLKLIGDTFSDVSLSIIPVPSFAVLTGWVRAPERMPAGFEYGDGASNKIVNLPFSSDEVRTAINQGGQVTELGIHWSSGLEFVINTKKNALTGIATTDHYDDGLDANCDEESVEGYLAAKAWVAGAEYAGLFRLFQLECGGEN